MTKRLIYTDNGILDTLLPPTRVTPALSERLAEARSDLSRRAGFPISRGEIIRHAIDHYLHNADPERLADYEKYKYGNHKMVITGVWVLKRQADLLNEAAIELNITRSEVMRRVMRLYLDSKEVAQTEI